ncbi:snapalysin [Streptomyces sp. TRM43335]|uniref:Extracellular small neutral protease n=1 Tax=Streptomyces taklimakanensis TaxID=2569853 RepID=A0A6G2B7D4_9ACTN|nr:snapalysin [Streptomyces taklimakanensis]MTE17979.1 snapalysin [Streptomyces taklimakanensis]
MKSSRLALSLTFGLGMAMSITAVPAAAAPAPADRLPASIAAYAGSAEDKANTRAFFEAVMESALAKQKTAGAQAVTVVYDASRAPSFATEIARSAQIWNSSVSNVRLVSGSNADFRYYEGNDSRGSYASTDGRGNGYIFLDYRQNQIYNSTRVTSHETGHVLGLPDHYSGPCSELMSGGGPGPSCTNAYPNASERSRVDRIWAYGLSAFQKEAVATR